MEKLLRSYIKNKMNWDNIDIYNWDVDGATCHVVYYTDEFHYEKEHININIWDMMVFLNEK